MIKRWKDVAEGKTFSKRCRCLLLVPLSFLRVRTIYTPLSSFVLFVRIQQLAAAFVARNNEPNDSATMERNGPMLTLMYYNNNILTGSRLFASIKMCHVVARGWKIACQLVQKMQRNDVSEDFEVQFISHEFVFLTTRSMLESCDFVIKDMKLEIETENRNRIINENW